MTIRHRILAICCCALLALAVLTGCGDGNSHANSNNAGRPNIVLITADDLGMHLSNYGDPYARTPRLAALAAESVQFNRAYVTQASCSPSRSSIFTGYYPHQTGQYGLGSMANQRYGYRMRGEFRTLPQYLKAAGYRTGVIGKVHVASDNPDAFPFDHENTDTLRTLDVERVAREAGQFLDANAGTPMFLMINYFDPHRHPQLPTSFHDQYEGQPPTVQSPEDVHTFAFMGFDPPQIRADVAGYYNSIARLDTGVGLVIDELKARELWDDTLFIFISDHGAPFTRAKTGNYEASVRVPLLVSWPAANARKGVQTPALVSSIDLLPTVLAAAGLASHSALPGFDLAPLLRGDVNTLPRTHIFTQFTAHSNAHYYPRRAVHGERFKLIHNLQHWRPNPLKQLADDAYSLSRKPAVSATTRALYDTWLHPPEYELYDLHNDPQEFVNLADVPEHAATRAALVEVLNKWRARSGDTATAHTANPSTTLR